MSTLTSTASCGCIATVKTEDTPRIVVDTCNQHKATPINMNLEYRPDRITRFSVAKASQDWATVEQLPVITIERIL